MANLPADNQQELAYPMAYNNSEIKLSSNQKHLGLALDSKLSLNEHTNDKIHQANKGAGLLRKL